MHIVHCLTHSNVGGGQQVVFTLVKNFKKYFPEVKMTVILPSGGVYVERFKTLGVDLREFPFDTLSLSSVYSFRAVLHSLNADIVHSHGKGAGFYARQKYKSKKNLKRVHSYHGFHPPALFPLKQVYLLQESSLLNRTDKLVLVSKSEEREVATYFPSAQKKISVIPNVVECEQAAYRLPNKLQHFFDTHKNAFIVAMIGRNDPIKNYPLALQTMDIVFSQLPDCALVVIGVNEQERVVREFKNNYGERICAVEEVESSLPVLQQSSLFFMTSKKEGSPLTVLEAFCAGKPVVGTNVPGIADVVVDGFNGLVSPENSSRLAEVVLKLQREKDLYARLCAGAAATAKEMNIAVWTKNYYTVYSELLS